MTMINDTIQFHISISLSYVLLHLSLPFEQKFAQKRSKSPIVASDSYIKRDCIKLDRRRRATDVL